MRGRKKEKKGFVLKEAQSYLRFILLLSWPPWFSAKGKKGEKKRGERKRKGGGP